MLTALPEENVKHLLTEFPPVARLPMRKVWGSVIGLASALALAAVAVMPAYAAGTVTQVILCPTSNSLTATIADMTLQPVTYTATNQESPGTITLTAAELGCAGQGWNVTVQASDWVRQSGGPAIPANAFALTQVEDPSTLSGQGVNPVGGPMLVNNLGTLNLSRKVLQANVGFGLGSYSQVLGVKLTIPPTALPGTYTSVVTTTITTGP
jgi:hypothetical protein